MPRRPENLHKAYHAHIYFDDATQDRARAVALEAGRRFKVQVGRMHPEKVGPHPTGSVQLAFAADQFDALIPWLDAQRADMDVFVHALSGDELADHTTYAYWLGKEWPLDLSIFKAG